MPKVPNIIFSVAHSDQKHTLNQRATLFISTRLSHYVRWWVIGIFEPFVGTTSWSAIDQLATGDPGDTIVDILLSWNYIFLFQITVSKGKKNKNEIVKTLLFALL